MEKLAEFHLDIRYIAGPANVVVDGLSRPPATTELQLLSDPTVRQTLLDWLAIVAPHVDLDECVSAGVSSLVASRMPQTLHCT